MKFCTIPLSWFGSGDGAPCCVDVTTELLTYKRDTRRTVLRRVGHASMLLLLLIVIFVVVLDRNWSSKSFAHYSHFIVYSSWTGRQTERQSDTVWPNLVSNVWVYCYSVQMSKCTYENNETFLISLRALFCIIPILYCVSLFLIRVPGSSVRLSVLQVGEI